MDFMRGEKDAASLHFSPEGASMYDIQKIGGFFDHPPPLDVRKIGVFLGPFPLLFRRLI